MVDAMTILNEKDPYLREIYAMGFDEVYTDSSTEMMTLIKRDNRTYKEINQRDLFSLTHPISIKRGMSMIDGSIHSWICERDGSADRFRNTINNLPELNKKHYICGK